MDIKWVKITTDMFDNRKIKAIRKLPEGNNIILIWVMLLTLAGRCNAGGMIFLTENIQYNISTLADELDFDDSVVAIALATLRKFGMILYDEESLEICNWEEYQNVAGMDRIREQNRLRKQNQREREKSLLPEVSQTCHVTSRDSHATEEDIEKEIDKELVKENVKRKAFVPPTVEEVEAYCRERGNHVDAEVFVAYYKTTGWKRSNGVKISDWKACVITWEKRDKSRRTVADEEEHPLPLPSSVVRREK